MRNRSRHWTLLGVISTFALVAAACGDGEATTTTAAGPPETVTVTVQVPGETVTSIVTETVEVPVMAPGSIVVMAKWGASGGEGDAFQQVLDAFTEKTGITVRYVGVGDELPTILSTQVEGGAPPDVAILPQPGLLIDLASIGALVPIEDAAGATLDSNFAPVWRELGSADGVLYGVFFKGANKSTVWYDVNVFADNGITPPTTWEEWVAAAGNLLDAGITPVAVAGADGWTLSDWFENVYLRTAGPEKYDQLTKHEIPWTDQSVKDALATMGELIGVSDFVARGSSGAGQVGFGDSVKLVFSDAPEAAIVYEGDFVAGVISAETSAQPGTGFDFFDFPSIGGSPPAVMGGGDVAVALTDAPEALALIEYLATPEAGQIWAALGGFSSPNMNVDLSVYPDDIGRAAAAALASAEVFRFDMSDLVPSALGGTTGSGIWGGLQNWLADPSSVDSVLEQLEADALAAFG